MDRVVEALRSLRVGKVIDEYSLHASIAEIFRISSIGYEKEHVLGLGSRVDFLTENGVAVEVKKGKPNRTQLAAQIERYAASPKVKAVVIVVETSLRLPISETRGGKPCAVLGLQKLWGIAL